MKNRRYAGTIKMFSTCCLAALFLASCASGPKGPRHFYPSDPALSGYTKKDTRWVYEDKSVRVVISPPGEGVNAQEGSFTEELTKKGYVLVRMDIENLSGKKIYYNPSLTTFTDDSMSYRKPLDYTDFFEIVREDPQMEKRLSAEKAGFYDTAANIPSGASVSKSLVFAPISKDAWSAEVQIKDLYVGTDTMSLRFPFKVR